MKTLKSILLICLAVLLTSYRCVRERNNCHPTITVRNNSDKRLYVMPDHSYPDTFAYQAERFNPLRYGSRQLILENQVNTIALTIRKCFESSYQYGAPSGIISFYFFDAEIIEQIPWDSIKYVNAVFKRYDLTLQDLRDLDWTIVYP